MGVHTHTRLHDLTGALDALPPTVADAATCAEPVARTLRATGTTDAAAQGAPEIQPVSIPIQNPISKGAICGDLPTLAATGCDEVVNKENGENRAFPSGNNDIPLTNTSDSDEAACRGRTGDLQFTKLLLCQLS